MPGMQAYCTYGTCRWGTMFCKSFILEIQGDEGDPSCCSQGCVDIKPVTDMAIWTHFYPTMRKSEFSKRGEEGTAMTAMTAMWSRSFASAYRGHSKMICRHNTIWYFKDTVNAVNENQWNRTLKRYFPEQNITLQHAERTTIAFELFRLLRGTNMVEISWGYWCAVRNFSFDVNITFRTTWLVTLYMPSQN